jgi:hypothetical protein
MGVVLEGLLNSALPKLTAVIGGPATMAIAGAAEGYAAVTKHNTKKANRTDYNQSLAYTNRERQRLVGETAGIMKSEAVTRNAAGNIREGVYGTSVDLFARDAKNEVQKQTNEAWQKPPKHSKKKDFIKNLGMAAAFVGGVFLGKKYGFGAPNSGGSANPIPVGKINY